ncbi:MAG: L-threonine 3-dehydrogenase [Spirochaetes bacterium]|nr:L-threonine 3-dehydrogenase [Spirochaetota bacterium]NLJ04788.1 L-threonine 3-dehydrogenase [Exilispira sp.]MBP8990789.1 L-threonine 3-dehydrogenase [Spirochaetota bacterium]HOV46469.1 L-threonine 3-dehydrogenase [Exilispira sp.]HPB47352.1 L-threonine 3-dehydrogenase [Exilispira sp.]
MKTQRAIVKEKPGAGVTLKEVPIPEKLGSKEILVKVKAASICGTDIHIYDWNDWAVKNIKPPRVIGHEFAAEVVEVGKEVTSIKVGDYVSAETHIACGTCYMCKTGNKHICQNMKIIGVQTDGAFTNYLVIPEENAWLNPPDLPIEIAAIQEPLGNAVYTVLSGDVAAKDMLITGAGPIGLMAIAVAKACGAGKIIVTEVAEKRKKLAKEMGADFVIDPTKENVLSMINDLTHGLGVDVGLEMSGKESALETLLKSMKKRGRVSLLGIFDSNPNVNLNDDIIFKGLDIHGITGRLMFQTWYQIKSLLENKRIDLTKIVTHKMPLEKFEDGIALLKKGEAVKVVLYPDQKI